MCECTSCNALWFDIVLLLCHWQQVTRLLVGNFKPQPTFFSFSHLLPSPYLEVKQKRYYKATIRLFSSTLLWIHDHFWRVEAGLREENSLTLSSFLSKLAAFPFRASWKFPVSSPYEICSSSSFTSILARYYLKHKLTWQLVYLIFSKDF